MTKELHRKKSLTARKMLMTLKKKRKTKAHFALLTPVGNRRCFRIIGRTVFINEI